MRFLVDECTGPAVAHWLRGLSHDVYSVYDASPGWDDAAVLALAYADNRNLITNDKDFGEAIFRDRSPHHGVILLRLIDERPGVKIAALERLLEQYGDQLEDRFVVASEHQVRFASTH